MNASHQPTNADLEHDKSTNEDLWNAVYPEPLRKQELELVRRRRDASTGAKDEPQGHTLGLALSGGGIRSATFGLGFLQALAKHRLPVRDAHSVSNRHPEQRSLLSLIDYLSTVSGGGFIGGFLGASHVPRHRYRLHLEELRVTDELLRELAHSAVKTSDALLQRLWRGLHPTTRQCLNAVNWNASPECSKPPVAVPIDSRSLPSDNPLQYLRSPAARLDILASLNSFIDFVAPSRSGTKQDLTRDLKSPPEMRLEEGRMDPAMARRRYIEGLFPNAIEPFVEKPWQEKVIQDLSDDSSYSIEWLRDCGRYLAPNGGGDILVAAATYLRNWATVMAIVGALALTVFLAANVFRAGLQVVPFTSGWIGEYFSPPTPPRFLWWSPYAILAAVMALLCLVPGLASWMIPSTKQLPLFQREVPLIVAILACLLLSWLYLTSWGEHYLPIVLTVATMTVLALVLLSVLYVALRSSRGFSNRVLPKDYAKWVRRPIGELLALGLVLLAASAGFALLDSCGQSIYLAWSEHRGGTLWTTALAGSATAALGAFGPKLASLLTSPRAASPLAGAKSLALPLVSGLALGLLLLNLNILAHAIAWNGLSPLDSENSMQPVPILIITGMTVLLSVVLGQRMPLLHESSLQYLYGSRMARAYLGASNHRREDPTAKAVTTLISGDDLFIPEYTPHRYGGPLHIINLTFNETCSSKTNLEQRHGKGMAFAVGPCGISVGRKHHALWNHIDKSAAFQESRMPQDLATAPSPPSRIQVKPIPSTGSASGFQIFPSDSVSGSDGSLEVQNISVGHWLALSGAAVGTGLGQRTKLSLSILAGLANIRLGSWWDSGVEPATRPTPTRNRETTAQCLGRWFSRLFPMQSYLLDEWLARFHGPARRYWYLSDGGHFENTAVYELIRRRVTHIICCDCGQDDGFRFSDIANLVRRVRIDFQANIEFFNEPELDYLQQEFGNEWDGGAQIRGFKPLRRSIHRDRHFLLARVFYEPNSKPGSLILFIKPAVLGDEPLDIQNYHQAHPKFPNEPTSDQFFDEAQWECYRKLGEHIGSKACRFVSGGNWWFLARSPEEFMTPRDHRR